MEGEGKGGEPKLPPIRYGVWGRLDSKREDLQREKEEETASISGEVC